MIQYIIDFYDRWLPHLITCLPCPKRPCVLYRECRICRICKWTADSWSDKFALFHWTIHLCRCCLVSPTLTLLSLSLGVLSFVWTSFYLRVLLGLRFTAILCLIRISFRFSGTLTKYVMTVFFYLSVDCVKHFLDIWMAYYIHRFEELSWCDYVLCADMFGSFL